jgi:hypothetical protein
MDLMFVRRDRLKAALDQHPCHRTA